MKKKELEAWTKRGLDAYYDLQKYEDIIKEFNKDNSKFNRIPSTPSSVLDRYHGICEIIGRHYLELMAKEKRK